MTAKLVLSAACVLGLITVGLSFMDSAGKAPRKPYAKANVGTDDIYSNTDVSQAEMENLESVLIADSWANAQRLSRVNSRPIMVIVDDESDVVDRFRRNDERGMMNAVTQKVVQYVIKPEEKEALGMEGSIALFELDGAKSVDLMPTDRLTDLAVRIGKLYR